MKNILACLLFIIIFSIKADAQQEHQFTQFMYNKLFINPAYAGSQGLGSFTAIYRNQWLGYNGSPESQLLSFHSPLGIERVGFGLVFSRHVVGITENWIGTMAYNYDLINRDDLTFRIGLHGAIKYFGIDFSDPDAVIRTTGDPSIVYNENKQSLYGNVGAGFYFSTKLFYIGASVPFILNNTIGFNDNINVVTAEETQHYYGMAGAMLPISEKVHIKPNVLLKYVENAPIDIDVNINFVFNYKFTIGASYRFGGIGDKGESIDLLAHFQANEQLGIGLAYDYNLSDLGDYTSGSVEALLIYRLKRKKDNISNPRFFF